MTREGNEASFGKETVRHRHLDGFYVRDDQGAFSGESHGQSALFTDTNIPQAFLTRVAFLDPWVHDKASHPAGSCIVRGQSS